MFTMDALSNVIRRLQNLYVMHMSITVRIQFDYLLYLCCFSFLHMTRNGLQYWGLCSGSCLCPPSWKNDISDQQYKYSK